MSMGAFEYGYQRGYPPRFEQWTSCPDCDARRREKERAARELAAIEARVAKDCYSGIEAAPDA